jgi:hypothetical protein
MVAAAIPVAELFVGAGSVYLDDVLLGMTRENNVARIMQDITAPTINGAGGTLARTHYHNQKPFMELEFTVLELSEEVLPLLIVGAEVATDGDNTVITAPVERRVGSDSYHTWAVRVPGLDGREIQFEARNAVAMANSEFTAADDGTAPLGPRITVTSNIDPDEPDTSGWSITKVPASYS